jgi:hypothetical protein
MAPGRDRCKRHQHLERIMGCVAVCPPWSTMQGLEKDYASKEQELATAEGAKVRSSAC